MTEKKEPEKQTKRKKQDLVPEQKVENEPAVTEGVEKSEEKPEVQAIEENVEVKEKQVEELDQEQLSSLDLLWRIAFGELDEWVKRADFRDEMFLTEAKRFAEGIERNQENIKAVSEKFSKEFAAWERTAREEFLMSTTSLAHFFPIKSYEEINQQIDRIHERTLSILKTPCSTVTNYQAAEKYYEAINQYIAIRKKFRLQYLNTVKQAGNLIYENQKGLVNLVSKQIKTLIFPLNKYLEKSEELSKS
jgi:hypothetical protein